MRRRVRTAVVAASCEFKRYDASLNFKNKTNKNYSPGATEKNSHFVPEKQPGVTAAQSQFSFLFVPVLVIKRQSTCLLLLFLIFVFFKHFVSRSFDKLPREKRKREIAKTKKKKESCHDKKSLEKYRAQAAHRTSLGVGDISTKKNRKLKLWDKQRSCLQKTTAFCYLVVLISNSER